MTLKVDLQPVVIITSGCRTVQRAYISQRRCARTVFRKSPESTGRKKWTDSGAHFTPAENILIVSTIDFACAAPCVCCSHIHHIHPWHSQSNNTHPLRWTLWRTVQTTTDARAQQTWVFVCLSAHCVNFTWELSWCVGCRCAWCVCQNREAVWMHWTWSKMACSFLTIRSLWIFHSARNSHTYSINPPNPRNWFWTVRIER